MEPVSKPALTRRIGRDGDAKSHHGDHAEGNGTSASRARVLVVEDDPTYGRYLQRMIERCGGAGIVVSSVQAATKQLASSVAWTALILDVSLPDGSGLHILRETRRVAPYLPALIVTGLLDHDVANTAFELGAKYLVKPVETAHVESFFHQAVEPAARLQSALDHSTARFGLSEAESDILLLAVEGHDREAISAIRGGSALTLKTHIHNLLQKTGDESLSVAVERVLREALHS
jgi:DNA-binding NarL/FixJ family response regulator